MDKTYFENYIKERFLPQITWYSEKAAVNKYLYGVTQWSMICFSTSLPVLISTLPQEYRIYTIIISIILAVCTAAIKTFKWQEKWIGYRTISELLKKEKYFFDAEISEYGNTAEKNKLFIERVELIMLNENENWKNLFSEKENKKKRINSD